MPAISTAATAIEFAHAARVLAGAARQRGYVAPSFRSPPRVVGVQRTIRRHAGGVVVAVLVRGRPWCAVVADMIEGVLATNQLRPPHGDQLRTELWEALGAALGDVPANASGVGRPKVA